MTKDGRAVPVTTSGSAVDAFLDQVAQAPVYSNPAGIGRLIFALDATASRQPTWDRACHIQAEMFTETASLGGLAIQMCYFRGFGEFKAAPWLTDGPSLVRRMAAVTCLAGTTQITRVFRHAIDETVKLRVNALVYVGDCMEESADALAGLAGQLGLLGVPAFMFQEGKDAAAMRAFRQAAELSGGAYMSFDDASAKSLRDLLKAVAVYAAGGRKALTHYADRAGGEVLRLTLQLR